MSDYKEIGEQREVERDVPSTRTRWSLRTVPKWGHAEHNGNLGKLPSEHRDQGSGVTILELSLSRPNPGPQPRIGSRCGNSPVSL
jgi:hypothetical protein